MRKNLYTSNFNFKTFLKGIATGLVLIYLSSFFVNYIIKTSEFRFSVIFSDQKLNNYDVFFLGNSRSVSFNKYTLQKPNILNLSYNSINYNELRDILFALNKKFKKKPLIYIELTSLIYDNTECRFTIFTHLENYKSSKDLEQNCKFQFYMEKIFPISKVKNEIFLRIFYYSIFKDRDQKWYNNYKMPEKTCLDGNLSIFAKEIIKEKNQKKILLKAKKILEKYPENNIKFFLTPIFSKKTNYALDIENKIKNVIGEKNFLVINKNLPKKFYKDCEMFADSLHLSLKGVKSIRFDN